MDELVAIVDPEGTVVGSALRSVVRRDNLRHAATAVLVRNSAGQIYVHLRAATKDWAPSHHDAAAGGILRFGEDPAQSAVREVAEELGIQTAGLRSLGLSAYDDDTTRVVEGMNAGTDIWTLMRQIQLPPELRVGQGYGKVSWAVRTFWEEYVGWFKLRSTTELYPDPVPAAMAELVDVAGVGATLDRAEAALERGDPVVAIRLGEAVEAVTPDDRRLAVLMSTAHQHLLDAGGDVSFWEHGWLQTQRDRWLAVAAGSTS